MHKHPTDNADFSFLQELNDSQRQAVQHIDGASLVIAGAGSGKTRVLTYKIAYLLKMGVESRSILALTFTNKAAREMKERIATIIGSDIARYLWMGTFHAIFSRILRSESAYTDFDNNFTIYDSADSKSLIKSIVKEMKLEDRFYNPNLVQSRISFAKNNLITPDMYAMNSKLLQNDTFSKIPLLQEIYKIYCNRCKQANAMDFDDLLLHTNLLFRNHASVLEKYQQEFQYILVDEYQDTNFAQYVIVKKLSEHHKKICVVGDDAQSIYSFRGANIDNMLQFQNTYTNAKIFKLEQNYRSTQTIVNAANSLIAKNKEQLKKNVFSEKEVGSPINLLAVTTDLEEGFIVSKYIADFQNNDTYHLQDCAILYRTNAQSRVMEESLRKKNIPYKVYGGLSFYQRKEIKDVLAYCRIACNPNDEEALKRIINYPIRGIGDVTVDKIFAYSQLEGISVWDIISNPSQYNLSIHAGTALKLVHFKAMIDTFAEQVQTTDAYELVNNLVKETGIIAELYSSHSPENLSRQENVQELLKAIYEFCEIKQKEGQSIALLPEYLSEISLLTDQDTDKDAHKDKVTLMTVHAAKGLEFKAVFIVGMEENLFPSPFCTQNERMVEEERRLFYVAITRAKERCFISYAKSRFRNGKTQFSNPSRFIQDIDSEFLYLPSEYQEKVRPQHYGNSAWENFDNEKFEKPNFSNPLPKRLVKLDNHINNKVPLINVSLPVGATVKHSVFGLGKIMETSIVNGNEKADIDFGKKGIKSLLLKFAKLEIVQ